MEKFDFEERKETDFRNLLVRPVNRVSFFRGRLRTIEFAEQSLSRCGGARRGAARHSRVLLLSELN